MERNEKLEKLVRQRAVLREDIESKKADIKIIKEEMKEIKEEIEGLDDAMETLINEK